jgi:type I restriction enzyme S subunit
MKRAGEKNGNGQPDLRPSVRFSEFGEDGAWHTETIGEISEPIKEKVGEHKITPVSITAGVGFVPQADKFGRDISGEQYKNYTYLRRGDFAYNKGNSKSFPQGYVCQLHEFDEVAASSAFICFKLKDGYEPTFLKGLFDRNTHGRQLAAHITSGARSNGLLNLNAGQFYGVQLPFPPKFDEQERIAECLASIDTLIKAETEKLGALKDHKQGLMQQLFPAEGEDLPTLRFPEFVEHDGWAFSELGPMTDKVGSGVTPKGGDANYKTSGRPFLRSQNVGWGHLILEDVAHIDEETHRNMIGTELIQGDVLLNITGASIGRSAIADSRVEGGNVNQHVCIIRVKPEELNPEFLKQYLISSLGQSQIDQCQAGGNRQGLNFQQIRSFSIPLPPTLDEQRIIASALQSADEFLSEQASRLETLKNHKLGLLQQLFPILDEVDG